MNERSWVSCLGGASETAARCTVLSALKGFWRFIYIEDREPIIEPILEILAKRPRQIFGNRDPQMLQKFIAHGDAALTRLSY
jgi:hypothetical protein